MSRRLRNDNFERWPHQTFDEVTAMSCCVGFPNDHMRVHFWFAVLDRHIADQRQNFNLLVNRHMTVLLRRPIEVGHDSLREGADCGEMTPAKTLFGRERGKCGHGFVARLADEDECSK